MKMPKFRNHTIIWKHLGGGGGGGDQGWRSGESTRHHMWVEFVVGSRPCSERFFSVIRRPFFRGSARLLKNQHF